ncbi:MAG: zinc ribbon domain-containing protein [Candidatus Sulfotelmatobacter sp.]
MFCDGCGAAVQAGQAFCGACGKQIVGVIRPIFPARGRVGEHIHLLGILWLAISALNAVGGVVLYILANTLFAPGGRAGVPLFLHPLMGIFGVFVLGKSALGFVTGWGLMQRESWARVLAVILGLISLFNIPFGTAIGVYTLWVLLPAQSEEEFETLVAARRAA